MRLNTHKRFHKEYEKLSPKQKEKARTAVQKFVDDYPNLPASLRFHPLRGDWQGFHSISVGGDLRIHLRVDEETVTLQAIGTHTQLYE